MSNKISNAVIGRMPKYHRYLKQLNEQGVERISSKELGKLLDSTASQVRQDFNNFGGFGQQGYGYKVDELLSQIERILGLGLEYQTIIVGAGNIGQAMAKHDGFRKNGFVLKAMFDKDPKRLGVQCEYVEILHIDKLSTYLEEHEIDIAYICVGSKDAQNIAEILEKGGIKAIFNFAAIDLKLENEIPVRNVHLVEELFLLTYYLNGEAR